MSELSEERKRQIRAEEEARIRRQREEEERYREQVRRELEGQGAEAEAPTSEVSEANYREEVRRQLEDESLGAIPARVEAHPMQAAPPPPGAAVSRPHRRPAPRRAAWVFLAVGIVCVALGVRQGFSWPFRSEPKEIVLSATDTAPLVTVEKCPAAEPAAATRVAVMTPEAKLASEELSELPSDLADLDAPAVTPSAPAKGPADEGTPPGFSDGATTGPTSEPPATPAEGRRYALSGAAVSLAAPEGWFVDRPEGSLEFRKTKELDYQAPYVMLREETLEPGEDLTAFAKRIAREVIAGSGDPPAVVEDSKAIPSFHAMPVYMLLIGSPRSDVPVRSSKLCFIFNGKGYTVTCHAGYSDFASMAPLFEKTMQSLRVGGK